MTSDEIAAAIKSCPECGSTDTFFIKGHPKRGVDIVCYDCHFETGMHVTAEESIIAWNTALRKVR